jgi:hypothetical protein
VTFTRLQEHVARNELAILADGIDTHESLLLQ